MQHNPQTHEDDVNPDSAMIQLESIFSDKGLPSIRISAINIEDVFKTKHLAYSGGGTLLTGLIVYLNDHVQIIIWWNQKLHAFSVYQCTSIESQAIEDIDGNDTFKTVDILLRCIVATFKGFAVFSLSPYEVQELLLCDKKYENTLSYDEINGLSTA